MVVSRCTLKALQRPTTTGRVLGGAYKRLWISRRGMPGARYGKLTFAGNLLALRRLVLPASFCQQLACPATLMSQSVPVLVSQLHRCWKNNDTRNQCGCPIWSRCQGMSVDYKCESCLFRRPVWNYDSGLCSFTSQRLSNVAFPLLVTANVSGQLNKLLNNHRARGGFGQTL